MPADIHVLVVDDQQFFRETISAMLMERGFSATVCADAGSALDALKEKQFNAVLTDIVMPGASGIELLESCKRLNPDLPVILMTAFSDFDHAVKAVKNGAFDFLTKPVNEEYLIHTIETAAEHYRLRQFEKEHRKTLEETVSLKTRELTDALLMNKHLSLELIQRLTSIAEFRDPETGAHIARMAYYCRELALALNLPDDFVEKITFASPMHDIGKVGIPDNVLLKPGKLTHEEFAVMKTHTLIGHKLLAGSAHPSMQMAASVALNHHERWDGTGYPRGLKGENIPIEGRIMILCDSYDAARSKRPYKDAIDHKDAVEMLCRGDRYTTPNSFDPDVMRAFTKTAPVFDDIFNSHSEALKTAEEVVREA